MALVPNPGSMRVDIKATQVFIMFELVYLESGTGLLKTNFLDVLLGWLGQTNLM